MNLEGVCPNVLVPNSSVLKGIVDLITVKF